MYFTKNNDGNTTPLSLGNEIGSGGEGTVYTTSDGRCAKIYKSHARTYTRATKLSAMVQKKISVPSICWPTDLIYDEQNQVVGYLMNQAKGHSLFYVLNIPSRKRYFPEWTRIDLCQLATTIIQTFMDLHDNNIYVGDINEHNIMVEDANTVYFVDTDSYQFEDFTCPVGSPIYLHPDLQGLSLSTVKRESTHELFAVCTLIFRILMLGQAPYTVRDGDSGGSPSELIRGGLFPYPLGFSTRAKAPKGAWIPLWQGIELELKTLFYNAFAKNKMPNLFELGASLRRFQEHLEIGNFSNSLNVKQLRQTFLINISPPVIDDGRYRGLGERENIFPLQSYEALTKPETPLIFGVLELSTRACKSLVVDVRRLQDGFNWTIPQNLSELTELGTLVNTDREIPWETFEKNILPKIKKGIRFLNDNGATIVHCIATAALRGAKNREEILDKLQTTLGLQVEIIDREMEAGTTYSGYQWHPKFTPVSNTLLLDQGGGSTELTLFHPSSNDDLPSTNIPVGTTNAINIFFNQSQFDTKTSVALLQSQQITRRKINESTLRLQDLSISKIVGVGSAITSAAGGSNAQHHEKLVPREKLIRKQETIFDDLTTKYQVVGDVHKVFQSTNTNTIKKLRKQLVTYFGIQMVLHILDRLNLDSLTVNGMGLRYGVAYEMIQQYYPDLRSKKYLQRFKDASFDRLGVCEGSYDNGVISNIADFGIFVRLSNGETGLIHNSRYRNRDDVQFHVGSPLLVLVLKIKYDERRGRWAYDLDLPPRSDSSTHVRRYNRPTTTPTPDTSTDDSPPRRRIRIRRKSRDNDGNDNE